MLKNKAIPTYYEKNLLVQSAVGQFLLDRRGSGDVCEDGHIFFGREGNNMGEETFYMKFNLLKLL